MSAAWVTPEGFLCPMRWMVDFADAARFANASLRDARLDGEPRPDPRLVARRLGVTVISSPRHYLVGGVAQAALVGKRGVIRRAKDLRGSRLLFVLGHELGHLALMRSGHVVPSASVEAWCNAFAGALLVPRAPLAEAWGIGGDLGDVLERWPDVAPTCLALRVGEAGLASSVVVQGRSVRYARAERYDERAVVDVGVEASRLGSAVRPGVAKGWRLSEVRSRAAVVAA